MERVPRYAPPGHGPRGEASGAGSPASPALLVAPRARPAPSGARRRCLGSADVSGQSMQRPLQVQAQAQSLGDRTTGLSVLPGGAAAAPVTGAARRVARASETYPALPVVILVSASGPCPARGWTPLLAEPCPAVPSTRCGRAGHSPPACRDSTPGWQRGVSPWLDASWGRGGPPGCETEKNLLT